MPIIIYIAVPIILVALWVAWGAFGVWVSQNWIVGVNSDAIQRAGQWSDSFGAFNALVSALGFSAVLATLWLQAAALKEQARDQHRQRFETTFLNY